MKRYLIFLMLLSLVASSVSAQRRKGKAKKPSTEKVENPVFTSMLAATAKVTVVDSMVVDSTAVLQYLHANPEDGLLTTQKEFFHSGDNSVVFVNQLGDMCLFSKHSDDGDQYMLYKTEKMGNAWSDPVELTGINEEGELTDIAYPYLMPDGVTLYFSARGNGGLGGFDIYRTRFDAEKGKYLKPENLGLPFNSEADDYLFFIDEQNQLGYFASSRVQPLGKVCVYTFIPFETRTVLTSEANSPEKLRSLARLERIADTWTDETAVKKALYRKRQFAGNRPAVSTDDSDFEFIVNDLKTCTNLADFKDIDNRDRMKELLAMQQQCKMLKTSLDKARNYYANATVSERQHLKVEIMNSEQQYERLVEVIKQQEKLIRNTENQ